MSASTENASAPGPAVPAAFRRTPLYERHVAAGAKMAPFAGFEMPLEYAGVRAEHMSVREQCGMFDVSHMGEIETRGSRALELLQLLLSNDASQLTFDVPSGTGGAQYSVVCNEAGGVLDDVITYRIEPDRYLTVTNAANHARDLSWWQAHAEAFDGVEVIDRFEDFAMLAVQGPRAREAVQSISDSPLPARMTAASRRLAGVEALVCGTGYTGENGVELLFRPQDATELWDELVRRGASPAGLAARDTLRIEACFPLYGNDLMLERGPIEAGLGWCCREATAFIGSARVRAVREAGPSERLAPFAIDGPGIARAGHAVIGGGTVTSGTFSPSLGMGVGLAYLPAGSAGLGTALEIDVRGKIRRAVVKEKPLYSSGA